MTKSSNKLERLPTKYPVLFQYRTFDDKIYPFQAIDVGEGWYKILDRFARKATPIIKQYSTQDRPYLSTIKEKYGTIRIYFSHEPDDLSKLISQAEDESEVTCEVCGNEGKMRGKGWYYVACFKHTKDNDK